jgi:metal-sulfur cluster biosynthetic enzyme
VTGLSEARVLECLGTVVDPCMEAAGLGISVVDLGLVRSLTVSDRRIELALGLTEPGCAFTHALVIAVEDALAAVSDGREVCVRFEWREPWTEARMTARGRGILEGARQRGADLIASTGAGTSA